MFCDCKLEYTKIFLNTKYAEKGILWVKYIFLEREKQKTGNTLELGYC